jgi:hypothetical protein
MAGGWADKNQIITSISKRRFVLVFSYIGFISNKISVKGNTTFKCIY